MSSPRIRACSLTFSGLALSTARCAHHAAGKPEPATCSRAAIGYRWSLQIERAQRLTGMDKKSQRSNDLATPGSPATDATRPWPSLGRASARQSRSTSLSRPGLKPRAAYGAGRGVRAIGVGALRSRLSTTAAIGAVHGSGPGDRPRSFINLNRPTSTRPRAAARPGHDSVGHPIRSLTRCRRA
jgi:hypothetical protein